MKKILITIFTLIISLFVISLFFSKFGFQIGDTKYGKQVDLEIKQKTDIINSDFYTNYYNSNKLLVLTSWATWCKPCIEEIPSLNKLKSTFPNKSVIFLSLSIDKDSLELKKFIDLKKFEFKDITFDNLPYRSAIINTLDGKEIDNFIFVESVPNTYIIKNKKVIQKIEGQVDSSQLRKIIEKNL